MPKFVFAEVYKDFEDLFHYLSYNKNIPGMEPDDIFQECNIAFLDAIKHFEGSYDEFKKYAKSCVYNRLTDQFNKAIRHDNVCVSLEFTEIVIPVDFNTPLSLLIEEIKDKLDKEIDKLVFEEIIDPCEITKELSLQEAREKEELKKQGHNVRYTIPVIKQKHHYQALCITEEQFSCSLRRIRQTTLSVLNKT